MDPQAFLDHLTADPETDGSLVFSVALKGTETLTDVVVAPIPNTPPVLTKSETL